MCCEKSTRADQTCGERGDAEQPEHKGACAKTKLSQETGEQCSFRISVGFPSLAACVGELLHDGIKFRFLEENPIPGERCQQVKAGVEFFDTAGTGADEEVSDVLQRPSASISSP